MISMKTNKNILSVLFLLFVATPIMATGENSLDFSHSYGMIALSGGLCIGLATAFGSLSQSIVAASALTGIARNPEVAGKVFVPMILALALIESLVLFSLLISLTLVGKIV